MAIPCLVYPLSNVLTFKHPQKIIKTRKSLFPFKLPPSRGTVFCTTFMYVFWFLLQKRSIQYFPWLFSSSESKQVSFQKWSDWHKPKNTLAAGVELKSVSSVSCTDSVDCLRLESARRALYLGLHRKRGVSVALHYSEAKTSLSHYYQVSFLQ